MRQPVTSGVLLTALMRSDSLSTIGARAEQESLEHTGIERTRTCEGGVALSR